MSIPGLTERYITLTKNDSKYSIEIVRTKADNVRASERRRYTRYDSQQEIGYAFRLSDSEQNHSGIIVNMSRSGMCLCVSSPVIPGQEITIKRENQYYVNGTVVWCNGTGEGLNPYRVGLQFIQFI